MATTNLGKVSVTPKGEYDPLITYERLDVISHNGSSYIVKQALTGVTPIEGEFYALIAEKGDGGSFLEKSYKTYAAMELDKPNLAANISTRVSNDSDTTKNGSYTYDGTVFTRSQYDSKVVTDKIIADTAIAVQDAINNTAIEGGVLADTFVVVDGTLSQRTINKGLESIADLSTINNPKDGLRVYVKSYHAGLNKGGGYFTYDSSKANDNLTGVLEYGWVRDNETNGVYCLDWILPDGDIADISLYTSKALNVLSQSKYYHTLYCEGSFKFKNTLGTLTDGNEFKGGVFTAQNDLIAGALTVTGKASVTGVTIDVNEFQCADGGVIYFRDGGGVVSNCDIGNVKNVDAAEPFGNAYGIYSWGVTTYDLTVDRCYIHDIYAKGDGVRTSYGFCGGVFLNSSINPGETHTLEVTNSRLERFKTIFIEGSSEEVKLDDNDSDAIRVYTERDYPDLEERLHLISRNNVFNYCGKRFYKCTGGTVYAYNDRSDFYYTDICMNNVCQSNRAFIDSCNFKVNLSGNVLIVYGTKGKDSHITNTTVINYVPENPLDVYPPANMMSRGELVRSLTENNILIKNVHVEGLSSINRSPGNNSSPNLTIDGVTGFTLGVFIHWSTYAGTQLSVSNVDLEIRISKDYFTNAITPRTLYIITYPEGSGEWNEGVNAGNMPIAHFNNIVLRDKSMDGSNRLSSHFNGNHFFPIAASRIKAIFNNFKYISPSNSSYFGSNAIFDGAIHLILNNCVFDAVVTVRDITDIPHPSVLQVVNCIAYSFTDAGSTTQRKRIKNNVETSKFVGGSDYGDTFN